MSCNDYSFRYQGLHYLLPGIWCHQDYSMSFKEDTLPHFT